MRAEISPLTRSTMIEPETVEMSARPVPATVTVPLVVETRQAWSHSATRTEPEPVRRSASVTAPTRMEPLLEVTLTEPSRPFSFTPPDTVPATRSVPVGQRTVTDDDERTGRTSTTPPTLRPTSPPSSTTTSARSSATTVTVPDEVETRSWRRPGDGVGSVMGPHCRRPPAGRVVVVRHGRRAGPPGPSGRARPAPWRKPRRSRPGSPCHRYIARVPADAEVVLTDHGLSADEVVRVARGGARATLGPSAREAMAASAALIDGFLAADEPVYGVTTGFGSLATTRIPAERTAELQLALVRSHAAGMGADGRARGGAGDGPAAGPQPGHGVLRRPAGGGRGDAGPPRRRH